MAFDNMPDLMEQGKNHFIGAFMLPLIDIYLTHLCAPIPLRDSVILFRQIAEIYILNIFVMILRNAR
jgi:hypothetical protein